MTFIIAECGVNWRDLVDADDMIREAAKAGADAVKWQAYRPNFTSEDHPRWQELNRIALDESTVRYLYWRCQQHGIELMVTPFYPEAVAMLDPYVKRWKVRSADQKNGDILQACIKTGKETLISVQEPHVYLYPKMKELYCCPEYPPAQEPEIFAWGNTPAMLQEAGYFGYSCHIPDWKRASQAATHNDLKYLEVHVRLDRYEPHYCPIDVNVSITMSELAELCRRLKPNQSGCPECDRI